MNNPDPGIQVQAEINKKWLRLLSAVVSLNQVISKEAELRSAVKDKEDAAVGTAYSSLQWMEYLIQYSRVEKACKDDDPTISHDTASSTGAIGTVSLVSDVGGTACWDNHTDEKLLLHPLKVMQDLSPEETKETSASSNYVPPTISSSATDIDLGNSWKSWEQHVLLHFTPNPPPSFSIPPRNSSNDTTKPKSLDHDLYNSSYHNLHQQQQQYGFQIETLYERHDYEQQISCLQRLTQEFRTAWSRNEYALVHSILIRAVSHLSKSTTQLGSAGDSQPIMGIKTGNNTISTTTKDIFRRWYPVTFVYVVRLLDEFQLKFLHRMQSISDPKGKLSSVKGYSTYPPFYQNNNNVYSLQTHGSEFRVDFIAANNNNCNDHLNNNNNNNYVVNESSTEIFHEWLMKTRSTYHLVPRLYLEISLIQPWFYIASSTHTADEVIDRSTYHHQRHNISIHQLSSMLCGIGDPIVMIYIQCYIIHTLSHIIDSDKNSTTEITCFSKDDTLLLIIDFLYGFFSSLQLHGDGTRDSNTENRVKETIRLCFPAISQLFQFLIRYAPPNMLFSKHLDLHHKLVASFSLF